MKQEYSELNYSKIVNDLWRFRRLTGPGNESFQDFDQPGQFYFKILFDFDNNDDDANGLLGLQNINFNSLEPITSENSPISQKLGPDISSFRGYQGKNGDQPVYADTAFNFLLLNNELTRANYLKQFIKLLSEINTSSPWYWQSISGLDTLLERNMFGPDFKISEERKKITIKCLPDAYDTRIGTLLDLYRAVCYSYSQKKEILPANLRKFDMSIYIFHAPIDNMHAIHGPRMLSGKKHPGKNSELFSETGEFPSNTYIGYAKEDSHFYTGSKLIELHNCEIDINSVKSGLSEISNADGFGIEYSIDIFCDDAWENRYNEFVEWNIGDFISSDLIHNTVNMGQRTDASSNESYDVLGSPDNGVENIGDPGELEKRMDVEHYYYNESDFSGNKSQLYRDNIYGPGGLRSALRRISALGGGMVGYGISAAASAAGVTQAISTVKSKLLGNIYQLPLGGISGLSMDPLGTVTNMAQTAAKNAVRGALTNPPDGTSIGVGRKESLGQSIEQSASDVMPKYQEGNNVFGKDTYEIQKAQLVGKYNQNRNIFRNI